MYDETPVEGRDYLDHVGRGYDILSNAMYDWARIIGWVLVGIIGFPCYLLSKILDD